jgi:hypothetical protein
MPELGVGMVRVAVSEPLVVARGTLSVWELVWVGMDDSFDGENVGRVLSSFRELLGFQMNFGRFLKTSWNIY